MIDLRKWYTPQQPTVHPAGSRVSYHEMVPTLAIQSYVYCYWELKTNVQLTEPFIYRVIADGCMDVFFDASKPSDSFAMGFCEHYTEFPLEDTFHYIGIRFLPTAFPQLFRVSASELSNRFELLANVVPELAALIGTFNPSLSTLQKTAALDSYFIKRATAPEIDPDIRVFNAVSTILQRHGVVNVERDLDTGLSPRQLRRLFEFYIGDSAKTFSRIVRFQNVLRAKPSQQSIRENALFFDSGYYDQSHFIKEFKNFYGATPSEVFGRGD